MNINIKAEIIHRHSHSSNDDKLDKILESQLLIKQKLDKIMATSQQWQDALVRIEAGTTKAGLGVTAVGVRITALEEAIKNAGLPKEQEEAFLAQIEGVAASTEALATTLESMGKVPEDPIPDPVPDPIPPVEPV